MQVVAENDVSVLLNDLMDMNKNNNAVDFDARMSEFGLESQRRAPRESMAIVPGADLAFRPEMNIGQQPIRPMQPGGMKPAQQAKPVEQPMGYPIQVEAARQDSWRQPESSWGSNAYAQNVGWGQPI